MKSDKSDIFIEITITNDCNCNCEYCFEKCLSQQKTISGYEDRIIYLLIDACNNFDQDKHQWLTISFWGGEPFVNLDFVNRIIENTYQNSFVRYHFYSNGTLVDKYKEFLNQHFISQIYDRTHIQLSYDGEPHHSLKRGNNKDLIFEVADLLVDNKIHFDFKATLSYDMIKYLPEIWDSYYKLSQKYGPIVTYYPTLDTTNTKEEYFEDWKKVLSIIAKNEYFHILKYKRALFGWFNTGAKRNCNLNNSIHIHTDGNSYICHGCAYKEKNDNLKCGNIFNIQSLYELLSNKVDVDNIPEQCEKCPATYCSACHAIEIGENDNPKDKWISCRVNNISKCKFFKFFGYISKILQVCLDKKGCIK